MEKAELAANDLWHPAALAGYVFTLGLSKRCKNEFTSPENDHIRLDTIQKACVSPHNWLLLHVRNSDGRYHGLPLG